MASLQMALAVFRTAKERDASLLAAGFAYYAFVSFIPLILLALVVGSILGGEWVAQRLVRLVGDVMPDAGEDLIVQALETEAGRAQATVVALVVGVWGGLKVFRALTVAFDRLYGETDDPSILVQFLEGAAVTVGIAGGLGLMVLLGAVIGLAPFGLPFAGVIGWGVLVVGLFAAFLPFYYVLPPVRMTVLDAVPGAVLAAVGWTILQFGFQLYAANAARFEAYGAVGAVLLFVTFLYFAGLLILFGAVINVAISRPDRLA